MNFTIRGALIYGVINNNRYDLSIWDYTGDDYMEIADCGNARAAWKMAYTALRRRRWYEENV